MNTYIPSNTSASKIRIQQLQRWKQTQEKWAMLTVYDYLTAQIFDQAGIPVLLVGDSAANVVYGYDTTLPLTTDELLFLVKAVARGAHTAMIVADLVFGSYEVSPEQAYATATRFLKEGHAHAVKIEGGAKIAPHVQLLSQSGIPVMGHIGFTPQSIHALSGFKVQGTEEKMVQTLIDDAYALYEAGAFSIVVEMVPESVGTRLAQEIPIPIIGIGAGKGTDAQVLVWQDMAGLTAGKTAKFVKKYGNLRHTLTEIAQTYQSEVAQGIFPHTEHSY